MKAGTKLGVLETWLWKITITTELCNTLGGMFTVFEWSISWSGQPLTQCIPPKLSDSSTRGKLPGSFCHCMFLTVQRVTWSPPSYSSCLSVLSLPPWGHSKQGSSLFPKTVLKLFGRIPRSSPEPSLPLKYLLFPWVWRLFYRHGRSIYTWVSRCLNVTSVPGMIINKCSNNQFAVTLATTKKQGHQQSFQNSWLYQMNLISCCASVSWETC